MFKSRPMTPTTYQFVQRVITLLEANRPQRCFAVRWQDEDRGWRTVAVQAQSEAEARALVEDTLDVVTHQVLAA